VTVGWAAADPALLHCIASSFSVGDRSCWDSCFSATAPSTVSAAREVAPWPASAVTREPPDGALSELEETAVEPPRITTRLSVRERVRPLDRYLVACCWPLSFGSLPSSTPRPSASKFDSEGSTWARAQRLM